MASHLQILILMLSLFILYCIAGAQVSGPLMDCGPRLLSLIPCAPLVQGAVPTPESFCCDNLSDVYDQQPTCLCVFLSDPIFLSFPINQTLALQLPLLCNLAMSLATCSGPDVMTPKSPDSPPSPIPGGTDTNSSSAEGPNLATPKSPQSPIPAVSETNASATNSTTLALPPFSIIGYGFSNNAGTKIKIEEELIAAIVVSVFVGLMNRQ